MLRPEPSIEFPALQSVWSVIVPAAELLLLTVHPAEVCSVIVSVVALLTPSMISISPLLGQFGPKDQNAGQVLF